MRDSSCPDQNGPVTLAPAAFAVVIVLRLAKRDRISFRMGGMAAVAGRRNSGGSYNPDIRVRQIQVRDVREESRRS